MKKNQNESKVTKLTYFYVFSFVAIFVALVIFLALYFIKPFAYKKIEDLPEIEASEVATKHINEAGTQTSYYVLIYNKNNPVNGLIEETVVEYANLVRTQDKDGKLAKIYLLEYTAENEALIKALDSKIVNIDTCPVLVKIANKKVASGGLDLTVSDINDCLGDLIYDNTKEK